ncbi:MAG: hypothetical protein WAL56_13775 [Candidatus Sulfotelmatobacter sp.]
MTSTYRRIAGLLLLTLLASNLGPLAPAGTAASPHACCLRKAVHRCHDSAEGLSDAAEFVIRDGTCCGHGCCRAFVVIQCAYRQPESAAFFLGTISARMARAQEFSIAIAYAKFQSSRAPPAS